MLRRIKVLAEQCEITWLRPRYTDKGYIVKVARSNESVVQMSMNMYIRTVFALGVVCFTSGQIPIPKRPVGFVYNNGSPAAPVLLDVFMGPLCPDSRNAFPTCQQHCCNLV